MSLSGHRLARLTMERSFVFGILTPVFVFRDIPKGANLDGAFFGKRILHHIDGGPAEGLRKIMTLPMSVRLGRLPTYLWLDTGSKKRSPTDASSRSSSARCVKPTLRSDLSE